MIIVRFRLGERGMKKRIGVPSIKKAVLGLLVAAATLTGCGKTPAPAEGLADNTSPAQNETTALNIIIDDKYRTTYEVFVYSFYDSDGDGIGDLKGLTQKLDYINDGDTGTDTDLGCNQIWLMPISPSPTYHKYDVTDYKDIDPQYGTLEDFDELLKACHDRGVRVIIDTVFNHTSVEHPWFTEAAEFLKNHDELDIDEAKQQCPFINYYNFSSEQKDGYEPLPGTEYYYEARFWSGMPDLNLDSEDVRAELKDILKFWIDRGVDGFRMDAVTSYYTGDDIKNIEFMTWLNDTAKELDPETYIVCEAWTNSATYTKYYKSGIDSFFDFDYAGSEGLIAGIARGTTPASKYAESIAETEKTLLQINPDSVDAPFYTNHDMARSAGYFTGKGSEDKTKLAGALNLLMKGNAFIYYGEELGMKGSGKDENKRAPMQWTADANAEGMCDGPKDMEEVKMKYPALDEQQEDLFSIYNYFKNAIRLRNLYPVISRGNTTPIEELSGKEICAFVRSVTEEEEQEYLTASGDNDSGLFGPTQLLFIINTSGEEQTVDLSVAAEADAFTVIDYQLITSQVHASIENRTVTMPAYGIVIMR